MLGRGTSRLRLLLVLVTALALVFSLEVGAAAAAASEGGNAVAATKKRCKKGFKLVKKKGKKKCKRKKAPAPQPAIGSRVVASVTWTGAADLDLHAWDTSGNHSGFDYPGTGLLEFKIPSLAFSGDVGDQPGGESFTDQTFDANLVQPNRTFSFGICWLGAAAANYTINLVTPSGTASTETGTLNGASPAVEYTLPGGFNPPDTWCP